MSNYPSRWCPLHNLWYETLYWGHCPLCDAYAKIEDLENKLDAKYFNCSFLSKLHKLVGYFKRKQ